MSKRPPCEIQEQLTSHTAQDDDFARHAKDIAVDELLYHWPRIKEIKSSGRFWGDEIEYILVEFTPDGIALPARRQQQVLETLKQHERSICFQEEGTTMSIESTPAFPYDGSLAGLMHVESDMSHRRRCIQESLPANLAVMTIAALPSLGHWEQAKRPSSPEDERFHKRVLLSVQKLRDQRGGTYDIQVPRFHETAHFSVQSPQLEQKLASLPCEFRPEADVQPSEELSHGSSEHVVLDDLEYGASQCALQITMEASNLEEARRLYDFQLVLAPIMLALSAAVPVYRGYLVESDTRWGVLCTSFSGMQGDSTAILDRPLRAGSGASFIREGASIYADETYDEKIRARLSANGIDTTLAAHWAHTFHWKPVRLSQSNLENRDAEDLKTFHKFSTSVWPSVRFQVPMPSRDGERASWRVELRSMDVQLTDQENAAYAIFAFLACKMALQYGLDLEIPTNNLHENMCRANLRNAVLDQRFVFRSANWRKCSNGREASTNGTLQRKGPEHDSPVPPPESVDHDFMTIDHIVNGNGTPSSSARTAESFPGLIPLIWSYISEVEADDVVKDQIGKYLDIIAERARGERPTTATWMRQFIRTHPAYQADGKVPMSICFDLLAAAFRRS